MLFRLHWVFRELFQLFFLYNSCNMLSIYIKLLKIEEGRLHFHKANKIQKTPHLSVLIIYNLFLIKNLIKVTRSVTGK